MRVKSLLANILLIFCVIQLLQNAVAYRSEVEITPSPLEEPTTKKSGFFGGIKNFFRGTTTAEPVIVDVTTPKSAVSANIPTPQNTAPSSPNKPPPLVLPQNAPLQPLGPRPDTPSSGNYQGVNQQGFTFPTNNNLRPQSPQQSSHANGAAFGSSAANQASAVNQNGFAYNNNNMHSFSGAANQPSLPPGFTPYPKRPQPSGLDLSYGGGMAAGRPQSGNHAFGLATPSTTTTTTTAKPATAMAPKTPEMNFDLRGGFDTASTTTKRPSTPKEDFPALPSPGRPSVAKEDFPSLPSPKSPSPTPSGAPVRPSSPSAWNVPLPAAAATTPSTTGAKQPPASPTGGVSFVPHATGSSTTIRPAASGSAGNSVATDDEIRQLTENLYSKEINSQLNLIRVNIQGKTRSIDSTDEAPQKLLEVDAKALESPTIAKMRLLFNNYEVDTMVNEHVTPNERKEENDFLDAIMATSVMRQAMQFLQNKGLLSPDPKTHRDLVKELWFTQYSRGSGKIGSSGFEHVFVNEVKNGTIIGLHNWVYFFDEEQAGRLDYKGYLKEQDMGTKGKVLKVRFTHNNLNKPVNTLFIGTSPELELALYTVCFQLRPDRTCPVQLGNSKFGIVTYSWRYRGKNLIGSAYPEI